MIDGAAAPVEWQVEEGGAAHLLCSSRRFRVEPDGTLRECELARAMPAPLRNEGEPARRTSQQQEQANLVSELREVMGRVLSTVLPAAPGFVDP